MRKRTPRITGTLAVVGLTVLLLFRNGALSVGEGEGDEEDKRENETKIETEANAAEPSKAADEIEEITITIVVTQDQYLIDEQNVTLTQIKEKVTDASAIVKVVLEDNYASAKAWDNIKINLAQWGIIPIEQ